MIDWNATVAWIALAVALVSSVITPILTTILNNSHARKMQEADRQRYVRMEVFEDYLKKAALFTTSESSHSASSYRDFIAAHNRACIYASKNTREMMATFMTEKIKFVDENRLSALEEIANRMADD